MGGNAFLARRVGARNLDGFTCRNRKRLGVIPKPAHCRPHVFGGNRAHIGKQYFYALVSGNRNLFPRFYIVYPQFKSA